MRKFLYDSWWKYSVFYAIKRSKDGSFERYVEITL